MLDWAKAIHEAIGIDNPKAFIALFAIVGLLLFATVGWIVDRGYREKLKQETNQRTVLPAKITQIRTLRIVLARIYPSMPVATST